MHMLRFARSSASRGALMAAVATIVVSGCGSSKLVSQWSDPNAGGPPLRKILVIAVRNDPTRRRIWEDAFARAMSARGATVTPSWQEFPNALPDTSAVVAKVQQVGYDGVVVVRRTGRESQDRVVPASTTLEPITFWDDFSRTYVTYYREVTTPGYVETQDVVGSQIDVWRTSEGGRMVWSGLTETVDPSSPAEFSDDLSKLIVPELVKAGLL
jgi:hypothetical protein